MLAIFNHNHDPYFNLAAEEYVMFHFKEDIFMLWRNDPAIIVGKYQNAIAEINTDYVKENNIKVVRRMTGGGAVFHDLGNLNFTFIESNSSGNFRTFTEPILEVLQQLGVAAQFEGRNDLTINGQKFSGNAQCVHDGRILHHGTLLFSSEMADLSAALKVNPLKFTDKAVQSVRKRVTNISEHLPHPMTVTDFAQQIMQHVMNGKKESRHYTFTATDRRAIEKLRDEKYASWDWNFGQSPRYAFSKMIHTKGGNIEVHLNLQHAVITDIKFYGDFFAVGDISRFEQLFIGKRHHEEELKEVLRNIEIEKLFINVTADDIMALLF